MHPSKIKTHQDGIWISFDRELAISKEFDRCLKNANFEINNIDKLSYPYAYIYQKNGKKVYCRVVDSVFLEHPEALTDKDAVIITDNHAIIPIHSQCIRLIPEFWSIWSFDPIYQDRPATKGYNCFMNRLRGDRSIVFYELIKRKILDLGLVSYNCTQDQYQLGFVQHRLQYYQDQHTVGETLIPFNTVQSHGTLEQCIIDSNISLVLETYTSDSHIVFSEKIFRCLQMPRPWLLYCSPGAVSLLQSHGFDVLEDYVNLDYDKIQNHGKRLLTILDQLETFIIKQFEPSDYQRFHQAAQHNKKILQDLTTLWPDKLERILAEIKKL